MSEENKNNFSITQSPFVDNWWNNLNQDFQEKLRKIDKKSRENKLNFSLDLGKQGVGGSGYVFIPNSMPVEERKELLKGLDIGYVNEITPLDLGEDSEFDETGYEVYYGNPDSATKQKNQYYIPGRGWNMGTATGAYTLHGDNGLHSKNSKSLDQDNRQVFPTYTLWGENKNEVYDENGQYIGGYTNEKTHSGGIPEKGSKSTITFKANNKEFPLVISNNQFSGSYSSLDDIRPTVEWREIDEEEPDELPMWKALGFESIDAYVSDAYSNTLAIGDLRYAFPVDPRIEGEYMVPNLFKGMDVSRVDGKLVATKKNKNRQFRVDDPFDFHHILSWLPLNVDSFGKADDSTMSETGLINPSGENWKDREITIIKTFKFEGDDGKMYDAYETHPYEVTDEIAKTILQPLPEAPYQENGDWYYGGDLITEEDATAIKIHITDLKSKREKYFKDGWRLYLPDEKLLLDESIVYLNTFQNIFGDKAIQQFIEDDNVFKWITRNPIEFFGMGLDWGWESVTGTDYPGSNVEISKNPKLYGPDNKKWGELTHQEKLLYTKINGMFTREKNQIAISTFPEFAGYYTGGSDAYEESNLGALFIQMQKINGIWDAQGENANIPMKWEQLMQVNDWGQSMNDFSAMLVPLMATQGRLAYYFPATASSNTAIMATGGTVFSVFGGIKDYTDPTINKTFNEFMWDRGTDFFIGGAIPVGTGGLTFKGSNAWSKAYNKYIGGNPLGSFRAKQFGVNNSKEWSHRMTNYLYPTLKFKAQATGLNLTLLMGEFSHNLNHNVNNGVYHPDGDFISEPTFGQAVAYTAESMFGKDSDFGLNFLKQQLFATIIHGAFTFRPRTIRMYTDTKTGESFPFRFKGGPKDYWFNPKTNRLEYITEKEFKLKDNKITEEVVSSELPGGMAETKVTLGPIALRKYYHDYMKHTFKWSEHHYPDLFSLDGTFNINTHNKWVQEYHNQQAFRKQTAKNIIDNILELEGLTIDGKTLTKDDVRGLASGYAQVLFPNINNPNIFKLSKLQLHEKSIASYLEAGMQHSYNTYGNWYPGMNHLSLIDYKHFEPNLNSIRFQGNVPQNSTIDPLVNVLKGNPIYKGLDIVFLPGSNNIALNWEAIQFHDPFARKEQYENEPKLINKEGDATDGKNYGEEIGSNYIEGEDIYVLQAEGQNTVATDGTGQVIFSEGVGKDAIIEDAIVEPLYKLLEKVDPELKAEIDVLMKAMHQELIRNGISGEKIDYTELFSKAYTYNVLGYAEADPELAKWLHLPKDIVDRFGYWITYESGVDLNLIKGTEIAEEAPYTDITDILYGEPIEGGEIIYQDKSYKFRKNTNTDKNKIYISRGEDIMSKLQSASLKKRGVKNYLKRHGMSDAEMSELKIDIFLSSYKPTESIPSEVLIEWIQKNSFVLEEVIKTDIQTITGQDWYEPQYNVETRYDIDMGYGEMYSDISPNRDEFGTEQYLTSTDARIIKQEIIQDRYDEKINDIQDGTDGEFYFPDGEMENGFYAQDDLRLSENVGTEDNPRIAVQEYSEGDLVFQDEIDFQNFFEDRLEQEITIEEREYTDFDNPIEDKFEYENPETGEIIPLAEYRDYKLSGGENYQELLIVNPYLGYSESHWVGKTGLETLSDANNVIGHIRFQDVYLPGEGRILFIEEIQSKIHQKGAIDGYYTPDPITAQKPFNASRDAVPDAPLKDNWEKVYINRILQYAIDNGYDGISLIDGSRTAKRWDALTYVDKIEYKYVPSNKLPPNYSYEVVKPNEEYPNGKVIVSSGESKVFDIMPSNNETLLAEAIAGDVEFSEAIIESKIGQQYYKNRGQAFDKEYDVTLYDKDGRSTRKYLSEKEIRETFGWRGENIINGEGDVLENGKLSLSINQENLSGSGEFFLEFYDERLPNTLNKILQEYDLSLKNYTLNPLDFSYNRVGEHKTVFFNDKILNNRKDKPTPTYKIKKHKFKNKKVEKKFKESKIINSVKPSIAEDIVEGAKQFAFLFTRKYPEMPRGGKFALANDILRRYEASGDYTSEKGYIYLKEIIGDLNPKQFHNFERAVVMLDIYSDYQNGKPFTYFGFETEEGFLEAYDVINKMIEDDPMLKKAIERRRDVHEIVVDDLIDMGILDGETIGDKKDYFHHQVLMYQQLLNNGSTSLEVPTPGYGKQRIGGYDFNTNYLEAEYFYLSSALHDIQTIKIINEIENGYNIIDQVKADHKKETGSVKGWEKSIPEGYTIWRPDNKSIFYTTQSISEKDLNSFIEGVITNGDMTFDAQTLEGLKEMMTDVFVFGGKKDGIVIPIELSNTLKKHFEFQYENKLKTGINFTFNPVKLWKKLTLFRPGQVLKYNLNNLTGDLDAIVAANAPICSKFPEAFKIYTKHIRGQGTDDLYLEAVEMGVFNATFVNQEVKEFDAFKNLIDEKLKNAPGVLEDLYENLGIKAYWEFTTGMTAARENIMRLGAYIYYKERLSNGDTLEDIGYGGTRKTHLEGITNINHLAGILSRNITGDYGNISSGGQLLRDYVMPFYSFQEINLKRTTNLIENSIRSGNYDDFKSSIFGAGRQGAWAMWRFAKIWWWFGAITTWNNTGDRKEINDKLNDIEKNRLYLVTGESEEGKPEWFRFAGSSSEYLTWFGGEDIPMIYERLNSGEWTWDDVAEHCAKAPFQKSAELVGPQLKVPFEYLSGLKTWPDIFDMRERTPDQQSFTRIFMEQFGMEWLYDKVDGRPVKKGFFDYMNPMSNLITEVKVNEINYYDVKDQVKEYEKNKYGTDSGLQWNHKSTITKYYKQALRWGFEEEAEKWLNVLKAPESDGGFAMTDDDIEKKITNMNPLNYVKGQDIEDFLSTRTPKQLRQLDNAMTYYIETYNPKNMDKSLLYFDYRAKGLGSRIDATRDNYKKHLSANPNATKPMATFEWDEIKSLKEMSDELALNGNEKYSKKYLNLYLEGFELLFAEDLRMRINKTRDEFKDWDENGRVGPKPKPLYTKDEMKNFEGKVKDLFKDKTASDKLFDKYDQLLVTGMNLLKKIK